MTTEPFLVPRSFDQRLKLLAQVVDSWRGTQTAIEAAIVASVAHEMVTDFRDQNLLPPPAPTVSFHEPDAWDRFERAVSVADMGYGADSQVASAGRFERGVHVYPPRSLREAVISDDFHERGFSVTQRESRELDGLRSLSGPIGPSMPGPGW